MARRSSGRRTDYTWNGAGIQLSMAANAVAVSTLFTPLVSGTLIRVRGEILAALDTPTSNVVNLVSMGIIVATEEQIAVGATALPDPADDLDADWLWHGFIPLSSVGVAGDLSVENAGRLTVDSKAMRKMKQTQSGVMVIANPAFVGAVGVDVTFGIRALFGA